MAFIKFTIEELEIIRTIVGNKTRQVKNNIENFKTKTDLSAEKKQKCISEAEQEYASLALIEAKCMRMISDHMIEVYSEK